MFTHRSKRCILFEEIAERVWDDIAMQRTAGVQPQEPGVTSLIIALIRTAYNNDNHIGVWSNPAYNEPVNGGDIDVFVEARPNQFVWYSMQAKILKVNGRYMAMCHHGDYQWIKLRRLSGNGGCIPYFLLYNGDSHYTYQGIDKCNRRFNEKQFGCSLVTLEKIEEKSILEDGRCAPPHFYDFHPDDAEPWRILTCCKQPNIKNTFRLDQIKDYTEPYRLISELQPLGMEEEELFSSFDGEGSNKLSNIAKEFDHKPEHVLLFRRTTFPPDLN